MLAPRFVAGLTPPAAPGGSLWFAFKGDELLVAVGPDGARVPADLAALGLAPVRSQYLGTFDGRSCHAAELAGDLEPPPGHRFAGLRALHGKLDAAVMDVAGVAFQIQHWDRTHQYCGACAAPLAQKADERAKRCERCAADYFPRVSPAVIVLVHDGPRLLMTRQPRFPPNMYGLVAGFLEPGETLEACIEREVQEETGVIARNARYFGSQPWPFPHQVMIGFFAEYGGGEVVVERRELEDARFYHRDELPLLPPKISIARALIDAWLEGRSA